MPTQLAIRWKYDRVASKIRMDTPNFQCLQIFSPSQQFFWATHSGAELDLLFLHRGRRYGVEFKFNEAPKATRSMRIAIDDLELARLWIIYPGEHQYPVERKIDIWPLGKIPDLAGILQSKMDGTKGSRKNKITF